MPRFYLPQLLLLLWLLAGCQSSRPAYYFGHRTAPVPAAPVVVAAPDSTTANLDAPGLPSAALPLRSASALAGPQRLSTPRRYHHPPLPPRQLTAQKRAENVLRLVQPRQPQRHLARQLDFDPGPLLLFLLIALVVFLIVKFPLVTLIVLGVLALTALGILISLTTGHWAYG